jgi:1-acyl-sn-glycerol-3-phosphate acyltransferase
VRPGAVVEGNSAIGDAWSLILGDLPSENDPMLATLRAQRRVMPVLLFMMLRLLRLVMPRVVVSGRQHLPLSGPFIISPNHQSYLDPFFVCSVLPYRLFHRLFFVGAAEYFETATTAWAARQFSLVPVDPDANLVPAMKAGAFGLSRGRILVLFPEGERSIDGTVKPFKKGAAILSRHLKVPIVPVAIRGVFELWPRNRPFNWRLLLPWSGHRVRLTFGEPIQLPENVTYREAATILRQRIGAMWRDLDSSLQPGQQQANRDHAAREYNACFDAMRDEQGASHRRDTGCQHEPPIELLGTLL